MRYLLPLAVLVAVSPASSGQTRYLGLGAGFGVVAPLGGPWADRYGVAALASTRVEWALAPRWSVGLRGEVLFGDRVEEDPLAALRSGAGPVLGEDGLGEVGFSEVTLRARGLRVAALAGYDLPLGAGPWRLHVAAGPHYLEHRIRIQEDPALLTPQVDGDRRRGYDRRAGGWGGSADAGLRYRDPAGRFVGYLVAAGGLTASAELRDTQFDTGSAAYHDGADADGSLRLGVVLALLRGEGDGPAADDIYY